ncbi:hypothetical protein BCR41DRAFT_99735 [Lobosporangium transversale]|uniref:TPR-like protein n=1 Tax=Lobosporangium transversale TaxID=64571 RepID=A0A1Y2GJ07_9FUNG|nr:hypothetical protein BCR41DRAFT_99735 [Lobosporangium transversale]ORZ12440.1 hypothetical protein BCR41DRAFT_99735 [Lobosporangium transversale]|eukprot:XP_021880059.1 hypothetical protein BCR41DRAFT_99735 [Lobosporangium transversale]
MIEQIVEDRKILGSGNDADKRALVETIYRASQKTFQSPRILRFLFFALVELGQYDEAELALKAYLDQVEINLKVKSGAGIVDDQPLTHEQRIRQDTESDYDIAVVMVEGSRLYGKELGKPTEALSCVERALANIQQNLQKEDTHELLFNAYINQGVAHSLLASDAHEPEKRPSLYTNAIESFEKAIEVSPEAFEGHYYLALQLAEMREVSKAIAAVKQSVALNASHIPSWHLLALLLSAQKDYERALNICSVALKESDWDLPQTDGLSASQLEGEDYLALRITQAALQDQLYGPESALEPQEALFVLYTKVFAPEPGSVGESLYDIPKTNYASSITSIGSAGSKKKSKTIPPAAAAAAAAAAANAAANAAAGKTAAPQAIQRPIMKSVLRTARANHVLATLWLMSASVFRRLDRMEEALKAIEEAERVNASNPDVWYQLGLLYAAQGKQETASVSYSKALALAPYHPACLTRVGRSYLETGSVEMAESMLETTTKSRGWNYAEAWFYLGKVFEASDRLARAKECLWYALDLERSRPIRDFTDALPRYLA